MKTPILSIEKIIWSIKNTWRSNYFTWINSIIRDKSPVLGKNSYYLSYHLKRKPDHVCFWFFLCKIIKTNHVWLCLIFCKAKKHVIFLEQSFLNIWRIQRIMFNCCRLWLDLFFSMILVIIVKHLLYRDICPYLTFIYIQIDIVSHTRLIEYPIWPLLIPRSVISNHIRH